jgi:cytidylate kinase
MPRKVNIAIDGPAGAGKSSVAQEAAAALGYTYIDTGAMYRAVAYRALQAGFDVTLHAEQIGDLAGTLQFEFRNIDGERRLFVDGEDVSEVIRTPEVGNLSSPVSAIPVVRERLVAAQRRMASDGGTLMEGRDIGTVVLPSAEVKVFLTASPEERARRREAQLCEKGIVQGYDKILADITVRDERDSTRAVAPLKPAEDSVIVCTDNMTKDEVVARIVEIARAAEDAQA